MIIGRGAYKSTDAGKTWQFMGLKDAGQIRSIIIHPANPDVVWLAALGSPFRPTTSAASSRRPTAARRGRKRCS